MLDEISAEEIYKLIENKELINLDRKFIKGDLDLRKINIKLHESGKKTITESIIINNSTIDGALIFEDVVFCKAISFLNTNVNKMSRIKKVEFHSAIDFSLAEFHEGLILINSQFKEDIGFFGTKFHCFANLTENKFEKDILLVGSEFLSCEKKLPPDPDLSPNRWNLGNVTFSGSQFQGVANFYGKFQGKLDLSNCQFNKLYIRWDIIKDRVILDDTTYLLLIENFKKLGFFEDADNCYYEYRKTRKIKGFIRNIFDLAARLSFGYGVKPEFALASSISVVILFAILFYYLISITNQNISIGNALVLSITAFTSGANTIISLPNTLLLNGGLALLATFERLLGWAFFALLLASLGKTIIR
jgi:hypothetical protein